MGLKVVFTEGNNQHGPYELMSRSRWKQFSEWVESLPKTYWAVKTLVMRDEWDDTTELSKELKAALVNYPPEIPSVSRTVTEFLEKIGIGSPDEAAVILGS